jgi:hypothetical protein
MNMKKPLLLTILYIGLLTLLLPRQAQGSDYGLSISPPLLRVHIKPGKAITQVFKLENLGSTDKTLVASILPFTAADEQGNPVLNPKAGAPWLGYFSLANSQINLDQPFILKAGASEQLVLSLSIPGTAPLKDLYATLTLSTYENSLDQTFQGSVVRATIGANILITVSSQAYPDTVLIIEDFLPAQGSYLSLGSLIFVDSLTPLKFSAIVKNEGSFAAQTKGVFRITTGTDRPVYLEGILPVNVIAKSRRQLSNTKGEAFEFSPSLGQIGLHHIALEIKTDNSNTTSTINVFFFPLKLSLGLLLALMIIFSITKLTSKPQNNH